MPPQESCRVLLSVDSSLAPITRKARSRSEDAMNATRTAVVGGKKLWKSWLSDRIMYSQVHILESDDNKQSS